MAAASRPEPLRLAIVATRFLTRVPLPEVPLRDGDLRRAAGFFPLVGVLVAMVGIGVRAAAEPLWGPAAGTIAALAAMVAVTGAFHEDGLADTADGLWGGATPARRLEIMRDSRLGTYGVVALVAVLALRAALLLELDLAGFARAVLCGHVLGRAAALLVARALPAAAKGSGAEVAGGPATAGGWALAATTVAVTLAATTGWWAPVPLAAALAAAGLSAWLLHRRLGGVTGDGLGAANQLAALAAVAAVTALARAGAL